MNEKNKIKLFRIILNYAAAKNINKNILLKISQQMDKYIIEYYGKCEHVNKITKKSPC
jgi:hypothetical protein